jgi:hypothetical protein
MAQLLRTRLLEVVMAAKAKAEAEAGAAEPWAFVPPTQFMGNAMLSVYPPGSVGFATHTDTAARGDLRKVRGRREPPEAELYIRLRFAKKKNPHCFPPPPSLVHFVSLSRPPERAQLSVVYYLNKDWDEAYGGELVLNPGRASDEAIILPAMDQLVLLWSDRTEHTVRPTSNRAPPRHALSFWYLQDPSSVVEPAAA